MLVEEIMTQNVIHINSHETIAAACEKLINNKVGSLIVMDNDLTVGILTERDIIQHILQGSGDIRNVEIKSVMTPNIKSVHAKASLEKAAEIMKEHNIKKLPVVSNNNIIGIVTETDITRTVYACNQAIEDFTQFYLMSKTSMEKLLDDWGNLIIGLRNNIVLSNDKNFDEQIEEVIQIKPTQPQEEPATSTPGETTL
jgi:CBS domain-containing protein